MRLTDILFRRNRLPKGHLFRGKDRLVDPTRLCNLRLMKSRFEIEEQNMLWLRYPYLSEEQSFNHAKAMGKREVYTNKWKNETFSNIKPDVKLEDRLLHLKVTDNWE